MLAAFASPYLIAPAAPAQDAPSLPAPATVSVQRRPESVERIPMSASAFDQTDLDRKGIENLQRLQGEIPALVATDDLPDFVVRGVGSGIVGPGAENGFVMLNRGVYASRPGFLKNAFHDLERIEIVRGPQGPLYGRSATGGVLQVVPRTPSDVFEAGLDYEYGSYDKSRVRGVLNAPVANIDAAARLALLYTHRGGYYDQRFTEPNQRSLDRNDLSVRTSFSWQALESLRADLTWTFIREDSQGLDHKLLDDPRPTDSGGVGLDDFGAPGTGSNRIGALPSPTSARAGNENRRQIYENTIHFGTLTFAWTLGDLTLLSINGYQSNELFNSYDGDHTELDISSTEVFDDVRTWSIELNLKFDDGGPYKFVFGNVYFDEKVEGAGGQHQRLQRSAALRRHGGIDVPQDFDDLLSLDAEARNRTFAAFGDITYELRHDWRIRAGVRYSYTKRKFHDRSTNNAYLYDSSNRNGGLPLLIEEGGGTRKQSWGALTWRASTDFDLFEQVNVYAAVATANRPGGFDYLQAEPFRAEDILSVEIGSRARLFDERLFVSSSAFFYDHDDIQTRIFSVDSDRFESINIPSAEIFGIELEWLAEPFHGLLINGTFGWLDTRYDKSFEATPATPCRIGAESAAACPEAWSGSDGAYRVDQTRSEDLLGNRLPRAPRFSLNVGLQYSVRLSEWAELPAPFGGVLTPRFDYVFRDEIFFDVFNSDAFRQGSWDIANARLTYEKRFLDWGFRIEGYARNLWDEEVLLDAAPSSGGLQRIGFFNEPRSYGIRVGADWK